MAQEPIVSPDDYAAILAQLLKEKQKQAPIWYQLRAAARALEKAAELMGGDAARDLGSGKVSLEVPCRKCGRILIIERLATDFSPIEKTCSCGYKLYIR